MLRKGIRKTAKWVLSPTLKRKYEKYSAKDHDINFMGLDLVVKAGVFHPQFFFSTKSIIRYLETLELKDKTILELGCGSGAISVWSAKNGAQVTASDINEKAVLNAKENAKKNDVSIKTIQSDLFDKIELKEFNYVVINPPYYPEKPANLDEQAWYCGEGFEYFVHLFAQIGEQLENTQIIMVLSEDCDIKSISKKAGLNGLEMTAVFESKSVLEHSSLFEIVRS